MSDNPTDEALSVEAAINRTAIPILEFGRAWMLAPETGRRALELGLDGGLGFWANGRAGVVGEADADVAAAAIGFMAPAMVRHHWNHRDTGHSRSEITREYARVAVRFGRVALADLPELDLIRLTDLCNAVAEAALPSCGVLFAGWRRLPQPDDPAGAATVALNVLRELRGGAHLSAVHAVGIGPHGAIMAAPDPVRGGVAGAERFGWSAPHPEPDAQRRAGAERMTSEICRPAFEALDAAERADLVRLVDAARATLDRE